MATVCLVALVSYVLSAHDMLREKQLTCERYVLNVYLYLAFLVGLAGLVSLSVQFKKSNSDKIIMLSFVGLLSVILFNGFYVMQLPRRNQMPRHFVAISMALLYGVMLGVVIPLMNITNPWVIVLTLGQIAMVFAVLGIIAHYNEELLTNPVFRKKVMVAILIYLVVEILLGLFVASGWVDTLIYGTIGFAVVAFLGLLQTAKVIQESKTCSTEEEGLYPIYPEKGSTLFNTFMSLVFRMLGNRRQ